MLTAMLNAAAGGQVEQHEQERASLLEEAEGAEEGKLQLQAVVAAMGAELSQIKAELHRGGGGGS